MKNILLKAPYYSQLDNAAQPYRTCNSSVHAMLLNYLKPGAVKSDDDYWRRFIAPFGDSTDHSLHTAALKQFGIESEWHTDLGFSDLDSQLATGYPVAIGVAHRGPVTAPTGGHIILVVGVEYGAGLNSRNDDVWIVHDPFGNSFGYTNNQGANVRIPTLPSMKNRWLIDGPNAGWGRIITSVK